MIIETFAGVEGKKMKPTRQHRPVMGELMLGTVWAVSIEGEYRYFDYDWSAAAEWAGVSTASDVRIWKAQESRPIGPHEYIRRGQRLVWIKK